MSIAYEYLDYHGVGDEWQKVDRAVVPVLLITDDSREPKWDESNPKAALYVEAWKKLHGR